MRVICVYFKALFTCSILLIASSQEDELLQKSMAELELANLELQDDCENIASSLRDSILSNTFDEKIKIKEAHSELLKVLSENLRQYEDNIPPELLRNWTLLVKAGDALLPRHDWTKLIKFEVNHDQLIHTAKVHCQNGTTNCIYVKPGFEKILENSKNLTLLKKSWEAWQTMLSWRKNDYPEILKLVHSAAQRNEMENAKSYWEILVDKQDSYRQAEDFWDQIKPFYSKLHNFVRKRLFRFYNITTDDANEIPVFLLGSNFGNDWSQIADIILPHPQIYLQAEAHLNKTKIQEIFKQAEEVTRNLNLGGLGAKFWSKSVFNLSFCENYVLSHCSEEYSELLACDKVSWSSYLDAFEVALDVSLRNTNYLTLSQLNLRDSVIDEAVKGLGSIFAIKNLREKIWDSRLFLTDPSMTQPNQMTELLLIALRVLPKLPYYLAADKWRLDLLENGFGGFTEKWWNYRKEYQGVEGIYNNESDFLGDPFITSNKPYLSKFLGTILQFQILQYYQSDWRYPNASYVEIIGSDENFINMLHDRFSTEWANLVVNYFSIYDLSAEPLLDFFAPLINYFEEAPENQVIVTTPKAISTTKADLLEVFETTVKSVEIETVQKKIEDDEPPLPPKHEHVEENLEGPNPSMEMISTYCGIGLLVVVACIIVYVIVSKKMKRKRNNNRRFET